MKYIVILFLMFSQIALADCEIKSSSRLESERKVGKVTNLVKTLSYQQCDVKFNVVVDGENHEVIGSYKGLENDSMLCYNAVEHAKKELLISLNGIYLSDAVTVCRENGEINHKISIGDTILESEVGKSKINKYFEYRGNKCRMFVDHNVVKSGLREYHGVICQIEKSDTNWVVVDKW